MSEPSREALSIASVEDFLAWAEGRDEKWQLLDGALVMMTGDSGERQEAQRDRGLSAVQRPGCLKAL